MIQNTTITSLDNEFDNIFEVVNKYKGEGKCHLMTVDNNLSGFWIWKQGEAENGFNENMDYSYVKTLGNVWLDRERKRFKKISNFVEKILIVNTDEKCDSFSIKPPDSEVSKDFRCALKKIVGNNSGGVISRFMVNLVEKKVNQMGIETQDLINSAFETSEVKALKERLSSLKVFASSLKKLGDSIATSLHNVDVENLPMKKRKCCYYDTPNLYFRNRLFKKGITSVYLLDTSKLKKFDVDRINAKMKLLTETIKPLYDDYETQFLNLPEAMCKEILNKVQHLQSIVDFTCKTPKGAPTPDLRCQAYVCDMLQKIYRQFHKKLS